MGLDAVTANALDIVDCRPEPNGLDDRRRASLEAARVTRDIARRLAGVSRALEEHGCDAQDVAHFLMRCLFTMFAEDVELQGADVDHDLDLARWTVPVDGDDVYQVAVGPIHAGIIESGHFRFHVVGDRILHLDARLFYKHRGLERAAEGQGYGGEGDQAAHLRRDARHKGRA